MSDRPLCTMGRELEREGALIARARLGASLRVMERELIARGLAFGALIARARGAAERLLIDRGDADRLLMARDGADRLLGADRLARGALARGAEALPREAARLCPFERD